MCPIFEYSIRQNVNYLISNALKIMHIGYNETELWNYYYYYYSNYL